MSDMRDWSVTQDWDSKLSGGDPHVPEYDRRVSTPIGGSVFSTLGHRGFGEERMNDHLFKINIR